MKLFASLYYFVGNSFLRVRFLLRWIRSVLSKRVPVPRGFVISTKKWIESAADYGSVNGSYHEIHLPARCEPNLPPTIGERVHWTPHRNAVADVPATFVARIPNARVYNIDGDVITPDNRLLADVSLFHPRAAFRSSVIHAGWKAHEMPAINKMKGRTAVLASPHVRNYFHWMFQLLPRFELLRLSRFWDRIDFFILNPIDKQFQRETLNQLGLAQNKWIETNPQFHTEVEELYVTRTLRDIAHQSKWVIDWLRKNFIPASSSANLERIYISRSDAPHRRVQNEMECFEILERHGFQKVTLEGLSVLHQADLFAHAKFVVAPHGAGLANLAFCTEGASVLELVTPEHPNALYWQLAACAKLNYMYLKGAPYKIPGSRSQDFTVNCDQLKQVLAQWKI